MASNNPPRLAQLVTMIGDYYTFLTGFYLSSSALKYPPPEGWPNITADATQSLSKSLFVIEPMKYLPYIDETDSREMITNIQYKSDVVDYSAFTREDFERGNVLEGEEGVRQWVEEMENERRETGNESDTNEGDSEDEEKDSNDAGTSDDDSNSSDQDYDDDPDNIDLEDIFVPSLGYESGGRTVILNVKKGVIYKDMIGYMLRNGEAIEKYFANLRDKLQRLVCVPVRGKFYEDVPEVWDDGPVPNTADQSLGTYDEEHVKVFKRIYRKHGWPGEGYKKAEALEAVERYRRSIPEIIV